MEKVANKEEAKKPVAAAQENVHAQTVDAEKLAAFKKSKAEAAKRFKERRAAEAKDRVVKAQKMVKDLHDSKYWDKLPEDDRTFLNELANPVAKVSGGTNSLFKAIFGDSPKVGDSITLMKIFEKTLKSSAEVNRYVKIWAEKGTIVEFKPAANQLESTYTIKALGTN